MKLWRKLRQHDRIEALGQTVMEQSSQLLESAELAKSISGELSRERDKRIGFEALAAERRQEIERLSEEITFLRGEVDRVLSERLKSLDSLNQKLMEPRTEAPPPDMRQFQQIDSTANAGLQAVRRIRQIHNQMDMAILAGLHPNFAKKGAALPMNAPLPTQDDSAA